MNTPRARACLTALATAVLCGTTALALTPAGAATAIKKVPCTASTFTVVYDGTKQACYSGQGSISVAIPKVDGVQTGANTGRYTLMRTGGLDSQRFGPGEDIVVSPANTWEMTVIDITSN